MALYRDAGHHGYNSPNYFAGMISLVLGAISSPPQIPNTHGLIDRREFLPQCHPVIKFPPAFFESGSHPIQP